MKILFTKLNTTASNITVKYDESGNNTVTYPVSEIKQNNNEISFDSNVCADLDNIEISTGGSSVYKPDFNDINDYDVLFEYLNGCKTGKWVIDQEHFPNTWKRLFSPDHVIHSYEFHNIDELGENKTPSRYFKMILDNSYFSCGGISHAQELVESLPLVYDGKMYVYEQETYDYKEYNPETDMGRNIYLLRQYQTSSVDDSLFTLNEVRISNDTYRVIEQDGYFYIATTNDDGTIYENVVIKLQECAFEEADFYGVPQNYCFEYVGEGNGIYYVGIEIYSHLNYYHHYYNPNDYYSKDYNFVPTDSDVGLLDSDIGSCTEEILSLLANPNNDYNSNYQSAYKVYVDGYDLMDNNNIELSRKLLFMLTIIQDYWSKSRPFPLISYSSFNDNTLLNFCKSDYDSWYGPATLVNCNSIVKLLGRRRICNIYDVYYRKNGYYLNSLKDLDDDYFNSTQDLYIYERNIEDNDRLIDNGKYYIIPSSKKLPAKRLRNYGNYYSIGFYKGINSPKNNYILPNQYDLESLDPEEREFFTIE